MGVAMRGTRCQRWIRRTVVAVSVLALAALLVPNFVGCRCASPLTACKSNLKNIGTALEIYSTDHNGQYPGSLDELYPEYLKREPSCPQAKHATYRASFGPKAPFNDGNYQDYYLVECTGDNHPEVTDPDYPKYNGIFGLIERRKDVTTPEDGFVYPPQETRE